MAISDKITSIQNHLKDDWDSVESLIGDTELDKNIKNISSALDDLYNDLPKVTGSGTSITLDDTRKGRLESTLSGNTSQFTTTGKNLFNIEGRYETGTGISYTKNSDGSYTLNGTANGNNFLRGLCYLNEQHTISYTSSDTNNNVLIRTRTGTPSAQTGIQDQMAVSSISGNLTSSKQFDFVEISIVSGTTLNNFKIYIQLEKGSSVTSFEPYTGGQASPNPDYPQEVHIVSGNNKINVYGKNLLENQYLPIPSADNTATYEVKNAYLSQGTYTLATTDNSTFGNTVYIKLFKEDKQVVKESGHLSTSNGNYSINTYNYFIGTANNLTYIQFTIDDNYYARIGLLNSNNTKEVMLVKGTEIVRTYEPYSSNSYPINLGVKNLWGGFSNSFSRTDFGVQFTANQDGTITANGTATNTATSILLSEATSNGIYKTLQKGTYTVSGGGAKYNVEIYDKNNVVRLGGIDVNGSKVSFTINEETQIVLRIQVASGVTINETIKLQLEAGDKANSYTPYGTTPIELGETSTYKDKLIRTSGKNLFDSSITPENYYYDNNGEKVYQSGVEYINQEINNINYTSITISFLSSTGGASVRVCEYNLSGAFIARTLVNTNNQVVNLNNATTKIILSVNSDSNSYFTYLMINKGSSATLYEPYGTGEWYTHKEIGKVVLNGSENITTTTYSAGAYFHNIINIGMNGTNNDYAMSNYYTYSSSYMNNTCKTANGGKELVTRDNFDQSTYITWLGTNKPKFYYLLATPTYTKITYEPLLEQLETIYNAQGYDNQTNISQTNSDLPFKITASALKEWSI